MKPALTLITVLLLVPLAALYMRPTTEPNRCSEFAAFLYSNF